MAEVRKTQTTSTLPKGVPPVEEATSKTVKRSVTSKAAQPIEKTAKVVEKTKPEPVKASKATPSNPAPQTETPKAPAKAEVKTVAKVQKPKATPKAVEAAIEKAAPVKTPRKKAAPVITPEAIAWRAFELWQARGGVHGNDQEDWYRAEQELMAGH